MKKTTHSDKYRDVYKISWTDSNFQRLLAERISQSLDSKESSQSENDFLRVFPEKIGNQFTLGWMTERTLRRPRELLQLSRLYTESLPSNSPSDEALKNIEEEYSTWKKEDLCAEFVNQYPDLDRIFEFWKNKYFRTKYQIDEDTLEERMFEILDEVTINHDWFKSLEQDVDTKGLARILFDIGFFGDFIKGGDGGSKVIYFGETTNPLLKEVQVHPCFRKSVGTVQRNR
ncbi:P-loop ATPase, Sll1717 family [Vibrio cholerae]